MKPKSYFPYLLFRWFLIRQIGVLALLFVGLSVGLSAWLLAQGDGAQVTQVGLWLVLVALFLGFVSASLVSVIMARRMLIPLGRLIHKTRRTREFPFAQEEVNRDEEMPQDEPGEWVELERALNRLGRDLRNKTIGLSREKTELRAIMSSVSEAILAISKDRRLLFYNSHFAYLFNLRGASNDALLSEILRAPDVLAAYSAALAGETLRREIELTVDAERMPRHFQLSIAPLVKKHNSEIYGAVGILHDITELKRVERIRIEFVGNVSHELRTPVTTINGYVQTILQDVANGRMDQIAEFLSIVSQNVVRLKDLVEDLLDLSSLESGQELKIERTNVRLVTELVISQLDAKAHKIHMSYDFDEMDVDPKRLEQVMRNLLENAVRYVPAGRTIEIRWSEDLAAGIRRLSVKDDGHGIAAEHQARLFERFYRVDEGRSRSQGGTGIGLALVKHIMQRHGGRIRVESEIGRGAEFICEFPLSPKVSLK